MRKSFSITVGLAAIFVNLVLFSPLKAANWSAPVNLSVPGANAFQAQVAIDSAGRDIAVWSRFDGNHYVIQSSTKDDSGFWSTPATISMAGADAFFPQVVTDQRGNAIAIWARKSSTNIVIQSASKALKRGWSAPVDISAHDITGNDAAFPQIICNNNGDAYAVWQQYNGVRNDVIISTRDVGRGVWSAPTVLSTSEAPGLGDTRPKIAVDQTGNMIVVWNNSDVGAVQSVVKQKGQRWTQPVNISGVGSYVSDAQVKMDMKGNAIAVWTRSDGNNMIVQTSGKPLAGNWSTPINMSSPGEDAVFPCLAVNNDGNAIAAWQRFDGAYSIIQGATKPSKGNWSKPVDLTLTGEDASNPQVALGGSNAGVIVWKKSDGTNFVIEATTTAHGNAWSNPSVLSLSGEDSVNPNITIDKFGNAVAIWHRFDGSHTIVQSSSKAISP